MRLAQIERVHAGANTVFFQVKRVNNMWFIPMCVFFKKRQDVV